MSLVVMKIYTIVSKNSGMSIAAASHFFWPPFMQCFVLAISLVWKPVNTRPITPTSTTQRKMKAKQTRLLLQYTARTRARKRKSVAADDTKQKADMTY